MIEFILIYIAVGLLIIKLHDGYIIPPNFFNDANPKTIVILLSQIVGAIILVPIFTPIIVLHDLIRYGRMDTLFVKETDHSIDSAEESDSQEGIPSFRYMGGSGYIKCKDCDYQEGVLSFLHWLIDPEDRSLYSISGYQCQSCGKFHEIRDSQETDDMKCECGGELSRDKPIFCPQCKSKNVEYIMGMIT